MGGAGSCGVCRYAVCSSAEIGANKEKEPKQGREEARASKIGNRAARCQGGALKRADRQSGPQRRNAEGHREREAAEESSEAATDRAGSSRWRRQEAIA